MNKTDILGTGNNEGENIGWFDENLGSSGTILQGSVELPFETGAGLETTGSTQQFMTGDVMSVGGGVGDKAIEVTYSTKNPQGLSYGTGGQWQTTTTTTTTNTQYNYGVFSGVRKGGLLMGFGDARDAASDVIYSTKRDVDEVFHHRNKIWSWRRRWRIINRIWRFRRYCSRCNLLDWSWWIRNMIMHGNWANDNHH